MADDNTATTSTTSTPATGTVTVTTAKPETGAKPDDIDAMKAALKKANKEAEAARLKLKEIEDKEKTESEKLSEKALNAEKRAEQAELRALRLEVAVSKGLTPAQAKRIQGTTQEELEADADEFLQSISPTPGSNGKPSGKPTESLRGGGDPTEDVEEMDPTKLAADIPRY